MISFKFDPLFNENFFSNLISELHGPSLFRFGSWNLIFFEFLKMFLL